MSLLSALYTGASGLKTYGDSLQVIGDNIANVSTVSFKSARAQFANLLSQSIDAASGQNQIGSGVTLDSVSTDFAQGSFSNTDRMTDMAINGNGFFVVQDPNGAQCYTRNGQFTVTNAGNLVTSGGLDVVGYQFDSSGQSLGTLGPITLSQSSTQPKMTGDGTTAGSGVQINLNLNASDAPPAAFDVTQPSATSNFSTSINVYDSLGNSHAVGVYFNKTADNSWQWHALANGADISGGTPGTYVEGATGTLTFNGSGALASSATTSSSFNFTGTPQTVGFNFGTSIAAGGTGFGGSTQYASADSVATQSQDGYSSGSLSSVAIDPSGVISGTYSNGSTRSIGQIALANFANLQGLSKAGSGVYTATADSGLPVISKPNIGGFGTISSNSLELSNVDLATEFVNLVSNQNAYEANSKVITIGDQLLSDLVNIIR